MGAEAIGLCVDSMGGHERAETVEASQRRLNMYQRDVELSIFGIDLQVCETSVECSAANAEQPRGQRAVAP